MVQLNARWSSFAVVLTFFAVRCQADRTVTVNNAFGPPIPKTLCKSL